MGQQQTNVAQTMQNYQAQMDQANQLYNQLLNERNILRSIYGDMYDDEYKHRMQELEIWADNLQAETSRYAEQQANYRAQLAKQLNPYEQYLLDQEKAKNAKLNQVTKPESYITSGGEYKANGQYGTTKPTVDKVNGVTRYTYVAPNAIV